MRIWWGINTKFSPIFCWADLLFFNIIFGADFAKNFLFLIIILSQRIIYFIFYAEPTWPHVEPTSSRSSSKYPWAPRCVLSCHLTTRETIIINLIILVLINYNLLSYLNWIFSYWITVCIWETDIFRYRENLNEKKFLQSNALINSQDITNIHDILSKQRSLCGLLS